MIIQTYAYMAVLFVSLCQAQMIKEVTDKLIFKNIYKNGTEQLLREFNLSNFRFIVK